MVCKYDSRRIWHRVSLWLTWPKNDNRYLGDANVLMAPSCQIPGSVTVRHNRFFHVLNLYRKLGRYHYSTRYNAIIMCKTNSLFLSLIHVVDMPKQERHPIKTRKSNEGFHVYFISRQGFLAWSGSSPSPIKQKHRR
jgi:hypothetical protein